MVMRDGRIELYGPRDEVLARIAGPNVTPHPTPATRAAS
jgi:ABC-type protease/lipase transport system fused ATPase/permease subunit